jgi:hypothetical protein
MPLLRNKNQPYFPDPDAPNNYNCDGEQYCHPVQVGDTVMSQFYQTPCNNNEVEDPEFDDTTLGSELVADGDFTTCPGAWTLGGGWACDTGKITCTPGGSSSLASQGLTLVQGKIYQVDFTVSNRSAGSVNVYLGTTSNGSNTGYIDTNGNYSFILYFNENPIFGDIQILGSGTSSIYGGFNGSIDDVSVKEITYSDWEPNGSWYLNDGKACHIVGESGDLEETVANYIDAGSYYQVKFTLSNINDGNINVFLSNVATGTIAADGNYIFYLTPTANGVLTIEATSTFDGCISNIQVYKLRNDYTAELLDTDDVIRADVSDRFSYFEDYVTLQFQFQDYELPGGCYRLKVYDQCIIASDNLVFNGDFANGYDFWTRNNSFSQYDVAGNQMKLIFSPFTVGATDYISNGDFSSGTDWFINPGWTIAGGKAIHTPGNTGALLQTMTLPAPPPPAISFTYTVGFTVTNWTAGTITVKLGNAVNGTTYTWKGNDTFVQFYNPRQSGSVDIVFTPSSNFDGEIDDVKAVINPHSDFPFLTNAAQPLFTPGTYQTEWEIISSSDPGISARTQILTALPAPPYESAVAVHSYTQNFNNNGGNVILVANFNKSSIDYPQSNKVVGFIVVDNVSVEKIEPFEATYETECLNYNENGFPRSKMIVGWCDQPSFGFEFDNTGFRLQQRAIVRSIAPVYPKQVDVMKSGTGNARLTYAEIEKYWQLHTEFASETFHDAMSAIVSCDHFQIGDIEGSGVEYVAQPEDYTPNWQGDGSYSLATSVINLRVKDKGQVFNRHI